MADKRTRRGQYGLELMADREPCAGDCDVCDLFGELTPERVSRIRRGLNDERRDDD